MGELALGDRVQFVSGISDDELAELIASAEIAVVPSLYEGFSLPAVEHMASGTPLIASRTGALPEVVGDAAMLVSPGDAEELAAALRLLHDSPAERERLSAAALRRVQERFTWAAVARATVAEYRQAIAATRPRAGPSRPATRPARTTVLTVDFGRLPVGPGTGCSTWAAAPDGTRSRRCAGARTWSRWTPTWPS